MHDHIARQARRIAGADQHLNPECQASKHSNCDGSAWCLKGDERTDCGCACHEMSGELRKI